MHKQIILVLNIVILIATSMAINGCFLVTCGDRFGPCGSPAPKYVSAGRRPEVTIRGNDILFSAPRVMNRYRSYSIYEIKVVAADGQPVWHIKYIRKNPYVPDKNSKENMPAFDKSKPIVYGLAIPKATTVVPPSELVTGKTYKMFGTFFGYDPTNIGGSAHVAVSFKLVQNKSGKLDVQYLRTSNSREVP